MVARHSYAGRGQADLNFKDGDKLEILSEGNRSQIASNVAFLLGGQFWVRRLVSLVSFIIVQQRDLP